MAQLTKAAGGVSLATPLPSNECKITGVLAGEDLISGDTVDIRAGVWRKVGTGGALGLVCIVLTSAKSGEPITGWRNVMVRYGDNLTPGNIVMTSGAVAGALDDVSGLLVVGAVIDAQRIMFTGAIGAGS